MADNETIPLEVKVGKITFRVPMNAHTLGRWIVKLWLFLNLAHYAQRGVDVAAVMEQITKPELYESTGPARASKQLTE